MVSAVSRPRKSKIPPRHHGHFKMLFESFFLLWMLATAVLSTVSIAGETEQLDIDTGYYDLERAHNERAVMKVGKRVTIEKYVVVKVLNQYFTVGEEVPAGDRFTETDDGKTRTIIVY